MKKLEESERKKWMEVNRMVSAPVVDLQRKKNPRENIEEVRNLS